MDRDRDASTDKPTRRIDAARELVQLRQLRGSLALTPQPSLRNATLAGLQAALTVAIALPLVQISPWSHLIGYAALGALVALFGRFAPRQRRNRIVLISAFWQTLAVFGMSMAVLLGASMPLQLALLALACGGFYFATVTGRLGAPGALIFVFAAGASMSPVASFAQVAERSIATAAVAALGLLICALTENLRHVASPERPFPTEPMRPLNHRLIATARIVLGTGLAAYASDAMGAQYPAWAAMGTLAVMQGSHLHINMHRALQRMAGTMIGALLAWLILSQDPSVWLIIAALVLFQVTTEIIIGMNYGLGQIFVTPMALLMSHLAAPESTGPHVASERVLDTLLGVVIGILIATVLSSVDDRQHLSRRP